jgi:hypothetical protein
MSMSTSSKSFARARTIPTARLAFQDWRSSTIATKAQRAALARDLAPIAIYGEPRFPLAVADDPAIAIKLAYEHVWHAGVDGVRRNLFLSALWLWAADGNDAALEALVTIRRRVRARS